MFEHLKVTTLRASFEAEKSGRLPQFLGSAIRGVLGHSIRSFVCPTPKLKCFLCSVSNECGYATHFNSVGNEGGAVNPFVLRVITPQKTIWNKGDRLTFDITLIGQASSNPSLFLDAFQDMEQRGLGKQRLPFRLREISDPVEKKIIWKDGKWSLRHIQQSALMCKERETHSVYIRFQSPVRIQVSKRTLYSLSFVDIIRSLSRRLTLLTQAYSDYELNWNEEVMLAAAADIQTESQSWKLNDFKRYSMNHKDKLHLPGIEGWAHFKGNITPFTPLLEAGTQIHLGKNTTHGFGHYSIDFNEKRGDKNELVEKRLKMG
ncbi:CRISPR system precrRNA processing endoribonuclease RAMP protein Cas6 [Halalkalibacter oceani]|uniref:CRISPR system precrRNA processing endoribonuclease RAMP protein Cas6 n=1 Tax=Halalkalibacter oceani TaxID=1653776 RepID=UPI0033921BFD